MQTNSFVLQQFEFDRRQVYFNQNLFLNSSRIIYQQFRTLSEFIQTVLALLGSIWSGVISEVVAFGCIREVHEDRGVQVWLSQERACFSPCPGPFFLSLTLAFRLGVSDLSFLPSLLQKASGTLSLHVSIPFPEPYPLC